MNAAASIGRVVIFRSRTGKYDVPAIITATTETLAPEGVAAFEASGGARWVPPLTGEGHVHLTVFTPAGCYQEWDVPADWLVDELPDGNRDEVAPGTWRWPVIR